MAILRPVVGLVIRSKTVPKDAKKLSLIGVKESEICELLMGVSLSDFANFPKLNLDNYSKDVADSLATLDREFSKRRKLIAEKFHNVFTENLRKGKMTTIGKLEENFIEYVYLIPSLKSIAENVTSEMMRIFPLAVCIDKLSLSIPSTYIYEPDTNNRTPMLEKLTTLSYRMTNVFHVQNAIGIKRDEFEWFPNPLITPIRRLYKNTILDAIKKYPRLSEFDLSIQLLMHLAAKDISEVWSMPSRFLTLINQDLLNSAFGKKSQVLAEIYSLIHCGTIIPNDALVQSECTRLAVTLDNYFINLKVIDDDKNIYLPAQKMNDISKSPFRSIRNRAEIDLKGSFYMEKAGEKVLIAREKYSGKTIFFAPVRPEISRLYSRGFCNLHYANPGEIAVYGAFVEGEEMPFAYSSYGEIGYRYTREMLQFLGYHPATIVESSRAWNSAWAPENTMSVLFTYAKDRLAELYAKEGGKLEGIITSINPNLGFRASAFHGVHFKVVSVKPTVFSYYLDDNGDPTFMPKRDIASLLGVDISELQQEEHYTDNKIPFLPTVEMLYLLDKKKRAELDKAPIYVVTNDDYLYNR